MAVAAPIPGLTVPSLAALHGSAMPVEMPVAIEVNGIGLAVMMASPGDLEDYAIGFARTEGVLQRIEDLRDVTLHRHPVGWIARMRVRGDAARTAQARGRARITESACGLCGLETLEALAAPIAKTPRPLALTAAALDDAREALRHRPTGGRGMHAAALCTARGEIVTVRADVGRHNALDKLIGAEMAAGTDFTAHFALMTSRLSFELVEKAATVGLGALAALGSPTSMALDRAARAGLPLHANIGRGGTVGRA